MKFLNQEEAKRVCDKVIAYSKADQCEVGLSGSRSGNIRYANNAVSTAGLTENTQLSVTVAFGKRVGAASINEFDDKSLEKAVRRAEDVARLAPENPEFLPAIKPQQYKATPTWSKRTADIDPEYRAEVAFQSIDAARKAKLQAAGFFNDTTGFEALANSNGLFGYQELSNLGFTITARTEDGRGSGWATRYANDAGRFDAREASNVAIEKAVRSVDAKAMEPGRYTVILEPAATSDMLNFMFNAFDARRADEGRSFLSKKGGANRLGDKLYDEQVNVWADPWNPDVPVLPWDGATMQARERTDIIKNGVVSTLDYSRFWAGKNGKRATAQHGNIIMAGGSKSTEELIAGTKKGVLVTRLWYIRMVDPQSVALTGLTRDGTFYIENGKIKHPIKNFRFNESPVSMLNNIEELGKPVVVGGVGSRFQMLLPAMKIRDFNFTSLSDAV
ncbi:TldD/PmbA family protein [Pseudoduganella namucuonensis]|uniref:Predicted Zn-dependent protease or its inactivated homolog n=1 Tax=Pseudoduganella namucuonensis TaxID=1035707 RepID=A0A1I7LDC0_9BURK|nr:TldD/PmbA family protein [Pseudoduganella namucuonensis]SFV07722.1 Predicted Zn-dependent protease or its inactivated homolog [Pseudoduganella namucuonensis]